MEKYFTLSSSKSAASRSNRNSVSKSFVDAVSSSAFFIRLAELFSAIVEEPISSKQVLFLLNSMLACVMLIFPIEMPIIARIICFVWFCVSLIQCKQSGLKG
ncbi:MAG: hypothetical protein KBT29_02450 [Prevotellaceae bacterium]|nr:hypothetical protein [Candidatus Minthosoma caballi]